MSEMQSAIMHKMAAIVHEATRLVRKDFNNYAATAQNSVICKADRSGLPDYVTDTDREAEKIIRKGLGNAYPSIAFVGEECGGFYDQERFFLVDPLDGTSNFVALRDYFAVCAAYVENGEVVAAVIADPMKGTLVKAAKGKGAYLQTSYGLSKKLDLTALPPVEGLKQTQLECEMPLISTEEILALSPLLGAMSGFRKSGSTALDLLHLVCGRNIVCLSTNLAPFDIAAGTLIVKEAGGVITDMQGNEASYNANTILAGRKAQHAHVMKLLR